MVIIGFSALAENPTNQMEVNYVRNEKNGRSSAERQTLP